MNAYSVFSKCGLKERDRRQNGRCPRIVLVRVNNSTNPRMSHKAKVCGRAINNPCIKCNING